MDRSILPRGSSGIARPLAAAASLSPAHSKAVAQSHSADASATSSLGTKEDSCRAATSPRQSSSGGADDRQVAAADEADATGPSAFAQRAAGAASRFDGSPASQPGVDGGFQRMVSKWQWTASGTTDRAGYVQPIHL